MTFALLFISNFVPLFGIMFAMLFELCSASGLKPREKKLTDSPGKSKFPALCVILFLTKLKSLSSNKNKEKGTQITIENKC